MIKALTKNRITHTEDADILNIAREFYNGLYTSQEPSLSDIDAYLDQIRLPALTEDRQNLCDHAISLVECEVALGNMKPNSAVRRYGPLAPPLFFFLMSIIGKRKMCRN